MTEYFGYETRIPEDMRRVFMLLCQDVASLTQKWRLYLGLFSDRETGELLSDLARETFQIIEESLRNDMTMAIARLCDPVRSAGHECISFRALATSAPHIDHLAQKVDEFIELCKPIKAFRNKRVGHNDLKAMINPRDNTLPGISRNLINQVVASAGEILNYVVQKYGDLELVFEPINIGGADSLVFWLRAGKQHEDERRNIFLGKNKP